MSNQIRNPHSSETWDYGPLGSNVVKMEDPAASIVMAESVFHPEDESRLKIKERLTEKHSKQGPR
jgi:hypothetical protein